MGVMKCHYHDQVLKTVIDHLRRTGQALRLSNGAYSLTRGEADVKIVEKACLERMISLDPNGMIRIGDFEIPTGLDTAKIRRRVEDYLRRKATREEIIRIAACLGVRLR
ncbi:MAG: hypothetical protein HXX11_16125 [Desulfuromonadales bacterium]|nr:hypothetical protein [Desulfuromonadales bacterium]